MIKIVYLFFMLFWLSYVSNDKVHEYSLHINEIISPNMNDISRQSFELCIQDSYCQQLYDQHEDMNFTVFYYLFKNFLYNKHEVFKTKCKFFALGEFDCNKIYDSDEEGIINLFRQPTLVYMWINEMSLHISKLQLCDINYRFVINRNTMKGTCVCKFQEFCSNSTNDTLYNYLILSFILLFFIGVFYGNIWKVLIEKAAIYFVLLSFLTEKKNKILDKSQEQEMEIIDLYKRELKQSNKTNIDFKIMHIELIESILQIFLKAVS